MSSNEYIIESHGIECEWMSKGVLVCWHACISVDDAKLLQLYCIFNNLFTHILNFLFLHKIRLAFFCNLSLCECVCLRLIFMNSHHVQFIMSKVIALFNALKLMQKNLFVQLSCYTPTHYMQCSIIPVRCTMHMPHAAHTFIAWHICTHMSMRLLHVCVCVNMK